MFFLQINATEFSLPNEEEWKKEKSQTNGNLDISNSITQIYVVQ